MPVVDPTAAVAIASGVVLALALAWIRERYLAIERARNAHAEDVSRGTGNQ